MKITVITVLSCNLIWGSVDTQYIWTKNTFNKTMCGKADCEDLVVETVQGKVQGRAFVSVLNKTEYYGFLGIPYAKPPVNELRFQVSSDKCDIENFYVFTLHIRLPFLLKGSATC